jgi:hypothetical protein
MITKNIGTTAAWTLAFAFLSGCGSADAPDLRTDDGEELAAAPPASDAVDEGWFNRVQTRIDNGDHRFRAEGGALLADNPRHRLRARFGASGVGIVQKVASDDDGVEASSEIELDFAAWGRAGALRDVTDAEPALGVCNDIDRVDEDGECVERLERDHGSILEWWDNTSDGLQQAWELAERPSGSGEVQLAVEVRGATLSAGEDGAIELETANGVLFDYGKLIVTDADGRELAASLKADGERIVIAFDDTSARYPVTVDPYVVPTTWIMTGTQDNQYLGAALAGIGDVNRDGYDDVMLGAWGRGGNVGRVWAFYGSATGLPVDYAWTKPGSETGRFGYSVAGAGDVNGDGYSDAIVGEPYTTDGGKAHVFLGSSTGLGSSAAWTATTSYGGRFGYSVACSGDVDGDHYSDVLIGAPLASYPETNEGHVYLYRGSATGLSTSAAWARQSNQAGAMLGAALAGVGDINGDGLGDAVVGAPKYDGYGAIWVYVGHAGGTLGSNVFSDHGDQAGEDFGFAISGAGDKKGDGYADFVVGSGGWDRQSSTDAGRYFTYHNTPEGIASGTEVRDDASGGTFMGYSLANLGDVNGDGFGDSAVNRMTTTAAAIDNGYAIVKPATFLTLPETAVVTGAGDVNGDGYADALYSRPMDANKRGNAEVRHGYIEIPSWTTPAQGLSLPDSSTFGSTLSAVGDVNGDGFGDLVIGDYIFDDGQPGAGKVFLHLGSASGVSTSSAWSQSSGQLNAEFGSSVAGGDFNGDGYVDLAIGARSYDNGQTNEGRVSIYVGSASGIATQTPTLLEINQAGAMFGYKLASGDVNGDGLADLVASAPAYDNGQSDEGRVYLYLGSTSGLPSTTTLTFESDSAGANFGTALAMGDANCDGKADLVVGAENYSNGQATEGRIWGYNGSSTGLTATTFKPEFDQAGARFGSALTLDADMNGDGCADLVAAARSWSSGNSSEGRIFYYPGAASGLSSATAYIEGNEDNVGYGWNLSGGDFNADGYGDIAVGVPMDSNGALWVLRGSAAGLTTFHWYTSTGSGTFLGRALAFNGDFNGDGLSDVAANLVLSDGTGNVHIYRLERGGAALVLRRAGLSNPIPPGSKASSTSVDVTLNVRSAIGRTRAKLAVEMKPLGTPFDGKGLTESSSWTDTGRDGINLTLRVSGLTANKAYRYRARALYEPTSVAGPTHSRWYYGGKLGVQEGMHFRTP